MLLVLHEILFHQSLTILNGIDFDLFRLLVNIGTRKKSVGILFKWVSPLNGIILNRLQLTSPIVFLFVNLQSGDGDLKEFILPFGIKSLLMIELLLLNLLFVLLFPHLDVSLQCAKTLLLIEGVLSHLVNSDLKCADSRVLDVTLTVSFI